MAGGCSSRMPNPNPSSVRMSLISWRDFRPKFLVRSISGSLFWTSSRMVRMLAFFRQLDERTESSSSSTLLSKCSLVTATGCSGSSAASSSSSSVASTSMKMSR